MIDIEKMIENAIEKQKVDFGFSPFDNDEFKGNMKKILESDIDTLNMENLFQFFQSILPKNIDLPESEKIQIETTDILK